MRVIMLTRWKVSTLILLTYVNFFGLYILLDFHHHTLPIIFNCACLLTANLFLFPAYSCVMKYSECSYFIAHITN